MPIPEYVTSLRRRVGRELLWLPGATAVVLDRGHILLVQRSDNREWTPVTGIVDPGEHPAVTAVRAVWEETTVRCRAVELVDVDVTDVTVHANGDVAQYLNHTYLCEHLEGVPHPGDDESVDAGWFEIDAMPEMSPALRRRVGAALERI